MAKSLRVEIIGDAASYARSLAVAEGETKGFGSTAGRAFAAVGKAALIAGAAGGAFAVAFGVKAVKAAVAAQEETDKLTVAFKNQGIAMSGLSPQVVQLEASSRELGFTNADTRESLLKLINSGKTYAQSVSEVAVAQNLARTSGQSLADATTGLIRLQAGMTRAAKAYGIVLPPITAAQDALKASKVDLTSAAGKEALAHAKVQDKLATGQAYYDALTTKVAGQGEAFSKTAAGGMSQFHAQLQNLEENLGAKMLPALASVLTEVNSHWPQIQQVATSVFSGVGTVIGSAVGVIRAHWQTLVAAGRVLVAALQALGNFLRSGIGAAFAVAGASALVLVKGFMAVRSAFISMQGVLGASAAGALGPVFLALGAAAAVVAAKFITGQLAANNMAAAFDRVKNAGETLQGTLTTLAGANLDVVAAKAQVIATSHQLEAALVAETQASDGTTKSTLAEKTAHDNVVGAKIAHQQAIQTLNTALGQQSDAQTKANDAMRNAVQPVIAFGAELGKVTGWTGLLGSKIPFLTNAVSGLTGGLIGNTGVTKVSAETARQWGIGVEKAGQQAFAAAIATKGMSPAMVAARQAMGLLTQAAGSFARENGKVPTSIGQIVAAAQKLHPEVFRNVMNAWIAAAQKAGVEVPAWARKAVAGVAAAAGPGAAAGHSVGSAIGAGINSGLAAWAYSVAAEAVAIVVNAANAARAAIGAKSPAKMTIELGKDFVLGLVQGIVQSQGLAEKAAAQAAQRTAAAATVALVTASPQFALAAKTLGLKGAEAVAMGVVAGTPSMASQMKAAFATAVATARTDFISKFDAVASAALAKFDARLAAWKPFSGAILAKMQLQDAVKGVGTALAEATVAAQSGGADLASALANIGGPVSDAMSKALSQIAGAKTMAALATVSRTAQAAITKTITDAAAPAAAAAQAAITAAQAALTTAQAGGDPEAIKAAQDALNQAVANQNTLEAAVRTAKETATGLLVTAEQTRHDQIGATQRTGLAAYLANERTLVTGSEANWEAVKAAVQKKVDEIIARMAPAGKKLATDFAQGIRDGTGEAVAAAQALAAAVAAVMPVSSPAKEGPLAVDIFQAGKRWAQDFGAGLAAGGMASAIRTATPPRSFSANGSYGAASPGGDTYNITVQSPLGINPPEIAAAIRREILRTEKRNVTAFAR